MSVDPKRPESTARPRASRRTASPPSYGRRRAVAGLLAGGLAVLVLIGFMRVSGGDAESAPGRTEPASTNVAPAITPPPGTSAAVTTSATTASSTAPSSTDPSIDTPGSLWWVVNPDRPMAADYVPPDLVTPDVPLKAGTGATQLSAATASAFEAMVTDAGAAGHALQLTSGYRSYDQQQMLYDRFVRDFGADVAVERVALPGTSEHQTGMAADVGLVNLPDDQTFGATEASVWVTDNAHRYGFILRYPPDKADITGYGNEPWHLRYVGIDLAGELFATDLTMEEYFGLVPEQP